MVVVTSLKIHENETDEIYIINEWMNKAPY